MVTNLRELPEGTRFMLIRTGNKYRYLGKRPSPYSGLIVHLCEREWGDYGKTSLHHSCHVKPVVRLMERA